MLLIGLVLVVGFALATVVYYFKLKSFKAEVSADYRTFLSEVSSLRKKGASGVALVESDFKSIESAFLNVFKKL